MSLTDLPKTVANFALSLVRVPLGLLERAIPGRGGDSEPVPEPKPAPKRKPAAKKPASAKKPVKPAAKPQKRATAAEEPGVVDESTDGLGAATDRAVTAREELEQSAGRDG